MACADEESRRYICIYTILELQKKEKKEDPEMRQREKGSKALRALYFACPAVIKSKIESK